MREKQAREWVFALGTLRLAVARYDAGWRTDGTPDLTPEGMKLREDRFREALQGFPTGWTDCEALETPSCRWFQRMRSALLRLG